MFQIPALSSKYRIYVPDLLFFGESISDSGEHSPEFQAECLAKGLKLLGVECCVVVAFSYRGIVEFWLAELQFDLVQHLVVSGSVVALTRSISDESLTRLGFVS
ncbi:Alpha/Beta hydrolase fold containing protein [Parasponia andersonii]|uniref:Alpha/Beta hydrolase fold containing protein n=1 Tax=Parasponia andersonii TaxID=3476 RepID=A0A2P5CA35_PARAD|nr:Alpha/Beta hydrolase fold containing protein [Parasponia andersonii]